MPGPEPTTPTHRRARPARPGWVDVVEQAVAVATPPCALPSMDTWQDAFAIPLRPFLTGARDGLIETARACLSPAQADPGRIADSFTSVLGRQLAQIAVRTMVHELRTARDNGWLAGRDGHERFNDFIWRLCEPAGLAALFERYPVLARLLGTASLQATRAGQELLTRLAADRAALVGELLGGTDPGAAVALEPGLGDRHRQGRSVTAVSFADGRRVVYKPRSLAAHALFGDVATWLSRRVPRAGLRTARVLIRPGYGWLEFVAARPLPCPDAADDFYRREGVLLAALHALCAVDMHCENVIACGDQPVLVDLETLFHPILPDPDAAGDDPAAQALATSVYRTALLPRLTVGEYGRADRSGMGGDGASICPDGVLDWDPPATDRTRLIRRAASARSELRNRPYRDGRCADPVDHESAVLEGFRLGYDAIVADRPGFIRLIESRARLETRIVLRPSRGYARLLEQSTGPDLLRDARARDAALDVLSHASAAHPVWRRMAPHELADLWAGDIPLVTGRPTARGLWTSAGQHLPGLLERPALSRTLDTIAAMGDVDRRDQEWIISASLATRRQTGGHRGAVPAQLPVTATAAPAPPARLLTAACGLADQIVARGLTPAGEPAPGRRGPSGSSAPGPGSSGRNAGRAAAPAPRDGTPQDGTTGDRTAGPGRARVNWLGLQLVEGTEWMVLPMGAGLADGYLGVALFLAQLARLTGIGRYAEVARRAVSPVPGLLGLLTGRSDLVATVGCGVTEGLGGISYALARMSTLLGDRGLADWAERTVQLAAVAAGLPAPPGWADGWAGCLAALSAVQAELGSDTAAAAARLCADRLTALVERTGGRCVAGDDPVPPGFAAGPAGIGWALTRFAAAAADPACRAAGRSAVRCAGDPAAGTGGDGSPGWCRGTAGLLAARSCLDEPRPRPAAQLFAGRPVLSDLSLCHGETGIAETLTVLAAAGPPAACQPAGVPPPWRHRAGLIVNALNRHSRFCGTPGEVPTPGLFRGLAGIGYGLLRLGFTERVPSVLFLEPTPDAKR